MYWIVLLCSVQLHRIIRDWPSCFPSFSPAQNTTCTEIARICGDKNLVFPRVFVVDNCQTFTAYD